MKKKEEYSKQSLVNQSLEEREYWESRGPLAEGHSGKFNKPKSAKRSSFLAIRLTGDELTMLRDVASRYGLPPSTYARAALHQAFDHDNQENYAGL